MRFIRLLPWLALIFSSCRKAPVPFGDLVREYTLTSMSYSPVAASAAGYHVHDGVPLDEQLDNYDETHLAKVREYLADFKKRLDDSVQPAVPRRKPAQSPKSASPRRRSIWLACNWRHLKAAVRQRRRRPRCASIWNRPCGAPRPICGCRTGRR